MLVDRTLLSLIENAVSTKSVLFTRKMVSYLIVCPPCGMTLTAASHCSPVYVWVPSVIRRAENGENYHVYQILVRVHKDEWNVYRRYSEFREFHKAVSDHVHALACLYTENHVTLKFPWKTAPKGYP